MDVKETLVEARRLVDSIGWTQGKYLKRDPDGNPTAYCMIGAVIYSGRDMEEQLAAMAELAKATGSSGSLLEFEELDDLPEDPTAVYHATQNWNDSPSRTKEQVLAAFDKAIASL